MSASYSIPVRVTFSSAKHRQQWSPHHTAGIGNTRPAHGKHPVIPTCATAAAAVAVVHRKSSVQRREYRCTRKPQSGLPNPEACPIQRLAAEEASKQNRDVGGLRLSYHWPTPFHQNINRKGFNPQLLWYCLYIYIFYKMEMYIF